MDVDDKNDTICADTVAAMRAAESTNNNAAWTLRIPPCVCRQSRIFEDDDPIPGSVRCAATVTLAQLVAYLGRTIHEAQDWPLRVGSIDLSHGYLAAADWADILALVSLFPHCEVVWLQHNYFLHVNEELITMGHRIRHVRFIVVQNTSTQSSVSQLPRDVLAKLIFLTEEDLVEATANNDDDSWVHLFSDAPPGMCTVVEQTHRAYDMWRHEHPDQQCRPEPTPSAVKPYVVRTLMHIDF